MVNKRTEILKHDISWYVNAISVKELDEPTIEHIQDSIKEGYSQGEICMTFGSKNDKETTGFWRIINWRDVANELYNACPVITDVQKKARKRFDRQWLY